MNQEKIGALISKLRKNKKITQSELAEQIGVTDRAISNWETGRRIPDIGSLKRLCEIFDITFTELLNGELMENSNREKITEELLMETYQNKSKSEKKLKARTVILGISILAIILILTSIVIYFKIEYPKIDHIKGIGVAPSKENTLKKYSKKGYINFWSYAIDSIQIQSDKNFTSLGRAIKFNQISVNQIEDFLNEETEKKYAERFFIKDVGAIYKTLHYTAVVCDSDDGNHDIYFGTPSFEEDLVGNYCGKKNVHEFTRTYYIQDILDDDDEEYINVTLSIFQGPSEFVRIKRNDILEKGKNYEFKFRTSVVFEDTIENIFKYSSILDIAKTDREGLDQINQFLIYQ